MIGVLTAKDELPVVREFFELFKTPWEEFNSETCYDVVISTGPLSRDLRAEVLFVFSSASTDFDVEMDCLVRPTQNTGSRFAHFGEEQFPLYGPVAIFEGGGRKIGSLEDESAVAVEFESHGMKGVRFGYDLFKEIALLLSRGQPPRNALYPTVEQHIAVLRHLILQAGIPVVEIPPAPPGRPFIACLTHDIDFLSLRQHRFDRTICGFLFRATMGAAFDFVRRRIGARRLAANWVAAAKLPFVHLGLCEDFWFPFQRYNQADGRPATFFLIPFRNRDGKAPAGSGSRHRATRYDVSDVVEQLQPLRDKGCEIAVHGIDAWHDAEMGRQELERVAAAACVPTPGVRMHWLYFAADSPRVLEEAGFEYDATCGYNDAVGYRVGTAQAFKPPGAKHLLELPFQVQDTALFYKDRMNLTEPEAWNRCIRLLHQSAKYGGVLVLSWHDRSLVPERLWGDFYAALLKEIEAALPWFGTAAQVVNWFRHRRSATFQHVDYADDSVNVTLDNSSGECQPPLALRVSWKDDAGGIQQAELPVRDRKDFCFSLKNSPRTTTAEFHHQEPLCRCS